MMAIVYLGIGSNMGNREKNIRDALALLSTLNITILKRSTIMESDPVGGPPQQKYLNAVIKAKTSLSPQDLLINLKSIEHQMGRIKTIKNGPRPIDIDILLYDNVHIQTSTLTIPHPRMLERDFVLRPLKEIEPDIIKLLKSESVKR